MPIELIVLRVVHILGGIFWVGSGLFTMFFLMPAMAPMGPAAGQLMTNLQKRRLFVYMPATAVLTILSGLRLMWIVSAGDPHWFVHRSGHTYAVSGALAIIAFLLAMIVSRPATVRMAKLTQSVASDEMSKKLIASEINKLQRRAAMTGTVAMVLLILAAVGMAIARYL